MVDVNVEARILKLEPALMGLLEELLTNARAALKQYAFREATEMFRQVFVFGWPFSETFESIKDEGEIGLITTARLKKMIDEGGTKFGNGSVVLSNTDGTSTIADAEGATKIMRGGNPGQGWSSVDDRGYDEHGQPRQGGGSKKKRKRRKRGGGPRKSKKNKTRRR